MIALADCNNFYASCERSFNPKLNNQPIIVLSNNDGCVIARSNEAKELGVKMGAPHFQIKDLIDEKGIKVFSSNYALYGDMSARVMATLGRFVEEVEIYSIDEAFLNLKGYEKHYPDLEAFARNLRSTVNQWTRIPISLGIAPTKTLAKVANKLAKSNPENGGVFMLRNNEQIQSALQSFEVGDLWGIGHRYVSLLKRNGIRTAWDLSQTPASWIEKHMTVNGLRLLNELQGMPCKLFELEPAPKKAICCAPSFGRLVMGLHTVRAALATHVTRAAEKLRKQGGAASSITVFLHTNRFATEKQNYYNSQSVQLPHPTGSMVELVRYAMAALEAIYKDKYAYQKVGVFLTGIVPAEHKQLDLFTDLPDARLTKLSQAVDGINSRFGRDKVRLAAQGYDQSWKMKQRWLSKCYTTRWSDILEVK